jgi:hypothetical protein
VRNISIKRLVTVIAATTIAVCAPSMQQAFAKPVPETAGVEELTLRFKLGLMMAMNNLIPALIGTLMAFFTRAAKDEPVFALSTKATE